MKIILPIDCLFKFSFQVDMFFLVVLGVFQFKSSKEPSFRDKIGLRTRTKEQLVFIFFRATVPCFQIYLKENYRKPICLLWRKMIVLTSRYYIAWNCRSWPYFNIFIVFDGLETSKMHINTLVVTLFQWTLKPRNITLI